MPAFAQIESSHRHRSPDTSGPLSPADRLLVAQNILLIAVSSWGGGGWLPGVLAIMLGLTAGGWLALWLRRREHEPIEPMALVPLALWLLLFAIAVANPSYIRSADGDAWFPRHGWIRWLPGTVSPAASWRAEMPWLVALSQAGILVATRPHRRAVRYIWTFAALNAFALAVIGAAVHFAQADRMLGVIETSESYFFATFFYKNHWVAYGWLGATAGAALALQAARRARAGDPRASGRAFFFGATALLTVITLPLPGSRSGVVLAAVFTLSLPVALLLKLRPEGEPWSRSRTAAAILAIILAAAMIASGISSYAVKAREDWERTENQLAASRHGESPEIRMLVSRDTWKMALDRPWFGWGIGSFELAFPMYQGNYVRDANGRPTARFEFAHNDWLQMFAEAGVAGLAILLVPLARLIHRGWRDGGPTGRVAILGCVVLALYAWIDFPLNNPAVLALWIMLIATAGRMGALPTPRSPEADSAG